MSNYYTFRKFVTFCCSIYALTLYFHSTKFYFLIYFHFKTLVYVPPFPVLRMWVPIWVSTGVCRGSPKLYLVTSGLKNIISANKLEKSSTLGKRMQVHTPNCCHLSEIVENFSHPNLLDDAHGVHKVLFQ